MDTHFVVVHWSGDRKKVMSRVCQQIFDLVVKETSLLPQSNHLRPWFPQQGAALSHPCPQCWWSSESHPSELSDKCKERCTEWCFQHECPKANPMACQWHLMENGRLPHLGNEVLTGHRCTRRGKTRQWCPEPTKSSESGCWGTVPIHSPGSLLCMAHTPTL